MTDEHTSRANGCLLSGLNGSNPLGYLAALGTLRLVSHAWPDRKIRVAWEVSDGAYRPRITSCESFTEKELITVAWDVLCHGTSASEREEAKQHRERLLQLRDEFDQQEASLKKQKLNKKQRDEKLKSLLAEQQLRLDAWRRIAHPQLQLGADTTVPPEEFLIMEQNAAETASHFHRAYADFVVALGSSCFQQENGRIEDTALRTMSGAGHQHFLGFMENLLLAVTPEHVRKSLLHDWVYDDPVQNLTMRWDPSDDARYALQWRDPSGDPRRRSGGSVLGANALAIAGLPLISCIPTKSGLRTVGFRGRGARDTYWIWPIWEPAIDMDTSRALVAHSLVGRLHTTLRTAEERRIRSDLAVLGVVRCFRSQRITVGKIRSFTPAEAV
ncbi:MAG: hypothetical protein RIC55_20455 [Pirellulaceae bacterium]